MEENKGRRECVGERVGGGERAWDIVKWRERERDERDRRRRERGGRGEF